MIKWKQISKTGRIPTRGSSGAAGFDLYANAAKSIAGGQRALVSTGIACAIPEGWVGIIKPRSSLAMQEITVDAGVIDSDYRGEVKVLLVNHGYGAFRVDPGDRIAQMVVVPHMSKAEAVNNLDDTDRGDGGWGSTGR